MKQTPTSTSAPEDFGRINENEITFSRLQFTLPFGWKPAFLYRILSKAQAQRFMSSDPETVSSRPPRVFGWSTPGAAIQEAISSFGCAGYDKFEVLVSFEVSYHSTHRVTPDVRLPAGLPVEAFEQWGSFWWCCDYGAVAGIMEMSPPAGWILARPSEALSEEQRGDAFELGADIGQWFRIPRGEDLVARLIRVNPDDGELTFSDAKTQKVFSITIGVPIEKVPAPIIRESKPAIEGGESFVIPFPTPATEPRYEFTVHWLDVFGDSQEIEHFESKEAAIDSITEEHFTETLLAAVVERTDRQEESQEIVYVKGDHEALVAGGWIDANEGA